MYLEGHDRTLTKKIMDPLIIVLSSAVGGILIGYLARKLIVARQIDNYEQKAAQSLKEARQKAEKELIKAKTKAVEILENARQEELKQKEELRKFEARLSKREERLEKEVEKTEESKNNLRAKAAQIKEIEERVKKLHEEAGKELEKVAGMSREEALKQLMGEVENQHQEALTTKIQKLETLSHEETNKRASEILASAMQRLASTYTEEHTTSTIALPSEEMKGRIIGKEGRNIRTFQKVTGVELIIDDVPDSVVISSFNPLRRQIAKVVLERLINDGRIQPARIEEIAQKVKDEFADKIKALGEETVYELGITDFDPKLVNLIGMLSFRTSYGQNLLRHSKEVAQLSAYLAQELDGDVVVAKKAGLLHDIGKAVSHEVEGTHVEIGKRIMEKFGVQREVIEAAIAHHEDYPFVSLASRIVQTADAVSASRPGARRESFDAYIKRLEELESLANNFPEVVKSYALAAGRELRIFVEPEAIDDVTAYQLAKNVANKIQADLTYPGEIKVIVIRETRAVEYAR